jgi:hypothetical protein
MSTWMPVFLVFSARRSHYASLPSEETVSKTNELSGKDFLQRIGTAVQQEDGSYLLDLAALPVNGKLLIKPPTEHDYRDPTHRGSR